MNSLTACENCQYEIDSRAKFCTHCGSRFSPSSEQGTEQLDSRLTQHDPLLRTTLLPITAGLIFLSWILVLSSLLASWVPWVALVLLAGVAIFSAAHLSDRVRIRDRMPRSAASLLLAWALLTAALVCFINRTIPLPIVSSPPSRQPAQPPTVQAEPQQPAHPIAGEPQTALVAPPNNVRADRSDKPAQPIAQNNGGIDTFVDRQNGYAFNVPHGLFSQSSGRSDQLRSPDGSATVSTWVSPTSLREEMARVQRDHPDWRITYRNQGRNYFVVSGYERGKIFYQKTIVRRHHSSSFIMKYNREDKDKYMRANEMLAGTFKQTYFFHS